MSVFQWPEEAVARSKGLAREWLADLRMEKLERGKHWDTVKRVVMFSDSGLHRLEGLLVPARIERTPAADVRAALKPVKLAGVVVAVFAKNARCLSVRLPDGREVGVEVGDNRNFVPGMAIEVKRGPRGEVWFEGRTPRMRGRW